MFDILYFCPNLFAIDFDKEGEGLSNLVQYRLECNVDG